MAGLIPGRKFEAYSFFAAALPDFFIFQPLKKFFVFSAALR
jgi:hypothetical protein